MPTRMFRFGLQVRTCLSIVIFQGSKRAGYNQNAAALPSVGTAARKLREMPVRRGRSRLHIAPLFRVALLDPVGPGVDPWASSETC